MIFELKLYAPSAHSFKGVRRHQRAMHIGACAATCEEYRRLEQAASRARPSALGFEAFLEFARQLDESGGQADVFVNWIALIVP